MNRDHNKDTKFQRFSVSIGKVPPPEAASNALIVSPNYVPDRDSFMKPMTLEKAQESFADLERLFQNDGLAISETSQPKDTNGHFAGHFTLDVPHGVSLESTKNAVTSLIEGLDQRKLNKTLTPAKQ